MTYFCFIAATFPFALYLIALALAQACSKRLVLDGRRDFLALAAAMSGLFFIGPGQLMAPWGACEIWGAYVWILIATLYLLVASMIGTIARTRLVVYNVTRASLRSALTLAALNLDADARWEGDALNLPNLEAQFYVDERGIGRVASLVAVKIGRASQVWHDLARELRTRLKETNSGTALWRAWLIVGVALLVADGLVLRQHCDKIIDVASLYLSI